MVCSGEWKMSLRRQENWRFCLMKKQIFIEQNILYVNWFLTWSWQDGRYYGSMIPKLPTRTFIIIIIILLITLNIYWETISCIIPCKNTPLWYFSTPKPYYQKVNIWYILKIDHRYLLLLLRNLKIVENPSKEQSIWKSPGICPSHEHCKVSTN